MSGWFDSAGVVTVDDEQHSFISSDLDGLDTTQAEFLWQPFCPNAQIPLMTGDVPALSQDVTPPERMGRHRRAYSVKEITLWSKRLALASP